MPKCCVCGCNVDGNPHPSPEGVTLCSKKCYRQWRTILLGVLHIKELIHYQPESEKEKLQDTCLRNSVTWLSNYEKQRDIEYIK